MIKNIKKNIEEITSNTTNPKINRYLSQVQKGLDSLLTSKLPTEGLDKTSKKGLFDILYFIGLFDIKFDLLSHPSNIKSVEGNLRNSLMKEGYKGKDADDLVKIISDYAKHLPEDIINNLLDQNSIVNIGEKQFAQRMHRIYEGNFFHTKENLIEKGIAGKENGTKFGMNIIYQYGPEFNDAISELSGKIEQIINRGKKKGKISKDFSFSPYYSNDKTNNIHTTILATPEVEEEMHYSNDIVDLVKQIDFSKLEFQPKKFLINSNSLLLSSEDKDGYYLQNMKKAISVGYKYGFKGSRGNHTTIGRFVGDIKDKEILTEIFDSIDEANQKISSIKQAPSKVSFCKFKAKFIPDDDSGTDDTGFHLENIYDKTI